jgi:choice-of-anchor B domain-containing protein
LTARVLVIRLLLLGLLVAGLAALAIGAAGAGAPAAAPAAGQPAAGQPAAGQPAARLAADGTPVPEDFPSHKVIEEEPVPGAIATFEPCVGGFAGIFPCDGVDLMSNIPLSGFPSSPTSASNLWAYVDLDDNREYAIIGVRNATAVVDVTDPINPVIVGSIAGPSSSWREVKVLQFFNNTTSRWDAYAYVVTDQVGVGVQIIDLSQLPTSISLANTWTGITTAHTVMISNVDWITNVPNQPGLPPILVLNGSNLGGIRLASLTDPVNPVALGAVTGSYAHDTYTHVFTDTRASQCAPGHNPCEVIFNFSGSGGLRIIDVTNKAAPFLITTYVYPQLGYTHSGWISQDNRYIFLDDELDEQNFGHNTRVRTINIDSLVAPIVTNDYYGPTLAIDHQGYTLGNKFYLANYRRGIAVLDVTNPNAPVETGFFDSYPADNNRGFSGAWGVSPYLPSGNILISDINRGLFVVREQASGPTPTPTATVTGTPPTATPTRTITPTATATGCVPGQTGYQYAAATATIIPGVTDVGNHCDDCVTTVSLPFPVMLYDQSFSTSITVSSNGPLQFSSAISPFTNACLPNASHNNTIFGYWDDLLTDGAGQGIFTTVVGSAPNRTFVIEWRAGYFSGGGTANFEVLLHENSASFETIYGTVTQGNASATVGVQRDTGSRFTQYACDGSGGPITSGLRLNWTLAPCGTPTPTATGGTPAPTATNTAPAATNTATATAAPPTATDTPPGPTATATSAPSFELYLPAIFYNSPQP